MQTRHNTPSGSVPTIIGVKINTTRLMCCGIFLEASEMDTFLIDRYEIDDYYIFNIYTPDSAAI